MDLSAVSPSPRSAQPFAERVAPAPLAPVESTRPETANAVQASAETQELADRPDRQAAGELSEEEQRVVRELQARDREVRAHEQAHKSVGGQYAGAISYDFQQGPDGRNYAVGGSVPIDVAAEDTPEETIAKMEIVIRAALAPAEPSAADRAIAAAANARLTQARADLAQQRAEERTGVPRDEGEITSAYNFSEENQDTNLSLVA